MRCKKCKTLLITVSFIYSVFVSLVCPNCQSTQMPEIPEMSREVRQESYRTINTSISGVYDTNFTTSDDFYFDKNNGDT